MATKLFIGNLAYKTNDDSLKAHFAQCGNVVSASVVMERETGRSRGFGFVEFATAEEATAAVEKLNGVELDGRALNVSEARERADRPARAPQGDRRW
jgi:RNA recognition motif-containing protein